MGLQLFILWFYLLFCRMKMKYNQDKSICEDKLMTLKDIGNKPA